MPIVSVDPQGIDTRIDTPKGFAVTPGEQDIDHGSDAPGIGSVIGAAFRQDNLVTNLTGRVSDQPDGTNVWEEIKGTKYEPRWESFIDTRSKAGVDARKRKIDQEDEDRKILHSAPWYQSVPAQIAAGVIDLPTLLPGGAFYRAAKGGFSVGKSALSVGAAAGVSTAAQEAGLQSLQETRPLSESAVNVGASVLLGGLLGAGGAKLLSKAEWSDAVTSIERGLDTAVPERPAAASAGAAAVEPHDLEGNTIAGRAAGALAASTAKLNPSLRLQTSPSAAVRDVAGNLIENTLYLKKNLDGVASEPAVETLMKEWNGGLAKAVRSTEEAFSDFRKAGGNLSRSEFRDAVGRAMRRGDVDGDPHVTKVAQAWRSQVLDPLKDAAIEAKLLPPDVSVETAASYFSRMWNRNKLIAQEGKFKNIVETYYDRRLAKEFAESAESHTKRIARLDQQISDLQLSGEARLAEGKSVEDMLARLESNADMMERADRLSELREQMSEARKAGDKTTVKEIREQIDGMEKANDGELKKFLEERSSLRQRRRSIEYGIAGMEERWQKVLERLGDVEEANFRSMERLVKRGQKLERDLDRLDADALQEKIDGLAESYGKIAQKAQSSAERANATIANIREAAERSTVRDAQAAQRASTEAKLGPPEEAAGKLAAAHEAAERNAAKRAAADAAITARLQKEAAYQTALAERMDKVAIRLRAAREFDHDGLMEEIRSSVEKAVRETSATSMARGERAAKLGERLLSLNPGRVLDRVRTLERMRSETDARFTERWEIGRGAMDVDAERRSANFRDASRQIASEVFDTLTGKITDAARPQFITIKSRGPMKERTFHIPDELVEDFLESDAELVGRRYARIMGADVELARKFGSADMTEQLQKVTDDYARLRAGVTDEKELTRLGNREKADKSDLEALRDLLRHGSIHNHPVEQNYARIVRGFNHINYIRLMGEVVLASLTDAVRPAMVHGLGQFMQTVPQLLTNLKGIKMSVGEAQLAGNVVERVLGHRLATISEIIDPYASRGPVESFLENMTNVASKWNGIRVWTDAMKSVASVMTQNRILNNAVNFGAVKDRERAYLAFLGIDQSMAERIAKQFAAHGEDVEGVKVANTEKWTDSVAVRAYRAAMNKDVDSIIVTKGVGDTPLFANTPTGRALLQFKSFALASHQRILLRGLQEDQSRFLGGLTAMTAIGMFITYLKALSGNRTEKQSSISENPGWWISEGLDRSGVMAVPMELANTFEKFTGVNPIKSPFKLGDKGNALSQKNQNRNEIGSMLGPTVGFAQDVITAGGIPRRLASGEEVTEGQQNAAERLLPFNSYAGLRQFMRYIVNPPGQ